MGVGLFVGVWLARYLGPNQYGLWSYAIAFTSIFGAIAPLGIGRILVRDLVRYPEKQNQLLGSSFVLKLLGGFIACLTSLIAISFIRPGETLTLWLISLFAGGFIFQSLNIIDYYFQSKVQSKYIVIASNTAFFIASLLKILLILMKASLIAFAIVGLIEIILTSSFFIIVYRYNHLSIRDWQFKKEIARQLFRDSWPLIIGSVSALIYMRIDQVMIGEMLGNESLGYYAVAVKLSEAFLFLTTIITQTTMPYITEAKKQSEELYLRRIQDLYSVLVKIAFFISVLISLFSRQIVTLLYTEKYLPSASILIIYIWSTIFVFLSNGSWSYYLNENLQHLASMRLIVGAIINVILNLILIKIYGLTGAALATLVSYSISSYFFNLFHPKLIMNFKLQTLAILSILNPNSYLFILNKMRG